MPSEVDICNLALVSLGEDQPIASINPPEASINAKYCATFYPIARDSVLSAHAWSFATRRVELSQIENTHPFYQYAYAYPSNCLLALSVGQSTELDNFEDNIFQIESIASGELVVLTNIEGAFLKYIHRVTDTAKFSVDCVTAISYLLASYLAMPITRKAGIEDRMLSKYNLFLGKATMLDTKAQRTGVYKNHEASWLQARGA